MFPWAFSEFVGQQFREMPDVCFQPIAVIKVERQSESMPSLVSFTNSAGLDRVVIEDIGGAFYAFGFLERAPSTPQWDFFLETIEQAKQFCEEQWGRTHKHMVTYGRAT